MPRTPVFLPVDPEPLPLAARLDPLGLAPEPDDCVAIREQGDILRPPSAA